MGRPLSAADETTNHSELRDIWSSVPTAELESVMRAEEAFNEDAAASKINLALPGFRDDSGKVFLPPTVRYAEKKLREEPLLSNELLPIEGHLPFLEAGIKFAYGEESHAIKNQRIASIQAISATGGLRLASTFLSRFPAVTTQRSIFIPNTMPDEEMVCLRDGGLDVKLYRFLDLRTGAVDWTGMQEDLSAAPARSAVLLYMSGSVPTGTEFTAPQWRVLTTLLLDRQLIPLVSMAFQGLCSGDVNRDAQPLRFMVHEGLPVVLVQSFDTVSEEEECGSDTQMMGLYAESPAIVSVATQKTDDRDRVDSQLRAFARAMYTHPPAQGARIAHMVLSDAKLYPAW